MFGVSNNHPLLPSHQSTGSLERSTSRLVLPLPDSDIQSSTPAPVSGAFTDEDGAGASATADTNTSTWSARNPHRQVIPPRTSKQKQLSEAERASCQIAAEQRSSKREALQADINTYLEEQKSKLDAIAMAHGITVKYLNSLVTSKTHYHTTRKPHLMNALMHAKAKEVNTGKDLLLFLSLEIIS